MSYNHNNPAPSPDDFAHEVGALEMDAANFEGVTITSENAGALRDIVARGNDIKKRMEAARKDAKQPHLDAGKAVDAAFKPPIENTTGIVTTAKSRLQAYLIAEQERERAEAEAARKAAEALKDDAIIGQRVTEIADAKAKQAEQAGRVASQDGIAKVASLRTYRFAQVDDATALVAHYASNPDMIALAEKLANADIRAAKGAEITIPGVTVAEEKRVA